MTSGAGDIDEPAEPWGAAAGDLVRTAAMGETAAWDVCSAATADSLCSICRDHRLSAVEALSITSVAAFTPGAPMPETCGRPIHM